MSKASNRHEFVKDDNGWWRLYEPPQVGCGYIIAADCASGMPGRNGSAAHVIRLDTHEQVCVISGEIPPEDFAVNLEMAVRWYNGALLAIELERFGEVVIHILRDKIQPNLYYHRESLSGFGGNVSTRYGWKPQGNRQTAIGLLKMGVALSASDSMVDRQNALIVNDLKTIEEMEYFVRDPETGKSEAAPGKTDDLVAALWIAEFVWSEKRRFWKPVVKIENPWTMGDNLYPERRNQGSRSLGVRNWQG